MSDLHTLDALLAAIDQAVHVPSATQPGKVTAPALNEVLRLLATELIGRASQGGSGPLLTAPNGTAYRLTVSNSGRLLVARADGALDPDAGAFCLAAGLQDEGQQQAVNALVLALKAGDVWDRLHALYPLVGGTAQAHALNLKDPRDDDAAYRLTFYGVPTHSSLGVGWDGASQYAATHYVPQDHLLPTSTHLAYYAATDDVSTVQVEMGCEANGRYFSLLAHYQGYSYFENCVGGQVQHPVPTGLGFSLGTRERADLLTLYRDGQALATAATPNDGFPGPALTLGCRAGNYPTKKTCALASFGAGLTPAQATAYSAAVATYQRALGRAAA